MTALELYFPFTDEKEVKYLSKSEVEGSSFLRNPWKLPTDKNYSVDLILK